MVYRREKHFRGEIGGKSRRVAPSCRKTEILHLGQARRILRSTRIIFLHIIYFEYTIVNDKTVTASFQESSFFFDSLLQGSFHKC